jgi:hypothetical protein
MQGEGWYAIVNQAELREREKSQRHVFDAFLRTQPYELRPGWESHGLDMPIDFINAEMRIGVELTEWRGQEQSQWVEERDRFREELLAAIEERGSSTFKRGGKGYTAEIQLEDGPPSRGSKQKIIADLLDFLDNFARTARFRFSPHGIADFPSAELPAALKQWISSIAIYEFPLGNLGIVVRRKGTGFDPALPNPISDVAISSFRERLTEKCVAGAAKYAREKAGLQLQELWLVVHYSSPGVFVEPLTELHMGIGYGEHRHRSQGAVAEKLKQIARGINGGPFDRIYFLVDCQPEPFAELIYGS